MSSSNQNAQMQNLQNKMKDLDEFKIQLEKLYFFVISGLIYLRKEHEKALVYLVEHYIELFLVIVQYK